METVEKRFRELGRALRERKQGQLLTIDEETYSGFEVHSRQLSRTFSQSLGQDSRGYFTFSENAFLGAAGRDGKARIREAIDATRKTDNQQNDLPPILIEGNSQYFVAMLQSKPFRLSIPDSLNKGFQDGGGRFRFAVENNDRELRLRLSFNEPVLKAIVKNAAKPIQEAIDEQTALYERLTGGKK